MSDVDRLFAAYVQEHRASGALDPSRYLQQLEGVDHAELAARIDRYLAHAPRRAFDAQAAADPRIAHLARAVEHALGGQAGMWPSLLPELRNTAKLRRQDLAKRLAAALGVAEREGKVAAYYHRMETGRLPSEGVTDRVLEALATILATTAEKLRHAGRASAGAGEPPGTPRAVFARAATPEPEAPSAPAAPRASPEGPWDEVDELFRGRTP
jgi:hypothetical protein